MKRKIVVAAFTDTTISILNNIAEKMAGKACHGYLYEPNVPTKLKSIKKNR